MVSWKKSREINSLLVVVYLKTKPTLQQQPSKLKKEILSTLALTAFRISSVVLKDASSDRRECVNWYLNCTHNLLTKLLYLLIAHGKHGAEIRSRQMMFS